MAEMAPSEHSQWQRYEAWSGAPLAAARVSPGAAQIHVACSHRDLQLRGAKSSPEQLTSLASLPSFVSLVPVRLPFPPLPPRPPKGPALAGTHPSNGSGPPSSPLCKQNSKQTASRDMQDSKIRLSCKAWLQTPTSRRLFTGKPSHTVSAWLAARHKCTCCVCVISLS